MMNLINLTEKEMECCNLCKHDWTLKTERENLYKECVPILEKLVSINENQEAVKTLMNIYGTLGNNEGFKQMKSLLQ